MCYSLHYLLVLALGQTATSTDRNRTRHTLTYDVLGRVISDAVTTLGAGVDGAVRRIETAYDGQGNPYFITSYDAASGDTIVNQVRQDYNGLGQLTNDWQEHAGAVTGSSVRVQYAYNEMAGGVNNSRQTSMTCPNGRVINDNYATGLDDAISRLSSLSDSSATLEAYSYLGLGTIVQRSHPQPGVDLTYIKQSGEANGDAGDQYTGLDRFGRVVDQRWIVASTGVATDRFQYGYDRDSNRTYRDNLVNVAFGEVYTYDGLNQVASFQRGTLNSTKDGIAGTASRSQSWNYDAAGNFDSATSDGTAQTRTANAQNEVTSVSGATTPTFDANGNMTGDETGKQFVYDAWNRLVAVKSASGTTLETFAYDGLNRRVSQTVSGTTTGLYYSNQWQVLEERVSGVATTQYVWSPAYVDALVERDRDTNGDGTLDERLYAQQDANYNTTALLNSSGSVVERYAYDAFGKQTVLNAAWTVIASSGVNWLTGYQGMRHDSISNLDEANRRWYSEVLGRWVTTDPKMFTAGDNNLYRFVGNDPVRYTDPTGLMTLKQHKGFRERIDEVVTKIKAKQISNCQAFALLMGLLYDINISNLRPGERLLMPHRAFGQTLKDAMFYFVDPQYWNLIGSADKFKGDPYDNYKPPSEIRNHGLGGLQQGYIYDPNDPAKDITGRHDHLILNAIAQANGIIWSTLAKMKQIIFEDSTNDMRVNGLGRKLGEMFNDVRFGRFESNTKDSWYPDTLRNGKNLTRWIYKNLCDDSKCGKSKFNPKNRLYD